MVIARTDRIIAAVDVGSSKVCALIAQRTEDGGLKVLGTGQRESRGVKRGYVADVGQCEIAIRNAVEQAESIAGLNIETAWIGFSAGGLESSFEPVELPLGGNRIEQDDIDHLLTVGGQGLDNKGKMVLHAQPAMYTLDGLEGVRNPLGLHADLLTVDIHVILADPSPVRNLEMAVRQALLHVDSIVAAPVAAGLSCLGEEERDLGVALVEMGASITNISLYAGGVLVALATIPMGAADITDDIASTFSIRRQQAERLKCRFGSAQSSPRDNHEVIDADIHQPGRDEEHRITRAQLIAVIRQRLDELTAEVKARLTEMGFMDRVGRQIVLTGGGAELKGIADYMQSALDRPVRVGKPQGIAAIPQAHGGPAFSTLFGLALHAASNPVDLRTLAASQPSGPKIGGMDMISKMIRVMKEAF